MKAINERWLIILVTSRECFCIISEVRKAVLNFFVFLESETQSCSATLLVTNQLNYYFSINLLAYFAQNLTFLIFTLFQAKYVNTNSGV